MDKIYAILSLFIGAGVFLVGIVMFSECLEKFASRGKGALFTKISDNRFVGFGIGAAVTAIIQSSAATIVTVLGLVNAGLLTLLQASYLMLGAHVGNTSTLFLISLSFFDVRYLFMAMAFFGAIMKMVSKKNKITKIANLFISFGILFVGFNLMSSALRGNAELREFFIGLFKTIGSPFLLIFLGLVFTVMLQSSTASTSLFLMMIGEGLLSFESALYLGLGATIGTSLTPMLASLASNTDAKRAALLNFLYGILGVTVFASVVWPLRLSILPAYERAIPLTWQYPVSLLIYNLLTALALIWFIKPLNRLVCLLLKEKPDSGKEPELQTSFIDDFLLSTPSLAVSQTKKEIKNMIDITHANLVDAFGALINRDLSSKKKIKKEENYIDFLNRAIAKYIAKLASSPISESEMILIGSFSYVINDIERVGDYAYKMIKDCNRMKKNDHKFSRKTAVQLQGMFSRVLELFDLCIEVFAQWDPEKQKGISRLEAEIEELRAKTELGHIMWLKAGQYVLSGGEYFYSTISDLRHIADHLSHAAFSMDPNPDRPIMDTEGEEEAG